MRALAIAIAAPTGVGSAVQPPASDNDTGGGDVIIRRFGEPLSGVRSRNPEIELAIARGREGEPVLRVVFPAATADPAGRDVWCEAENRDWSAGRAITFPILPDYSGGLSMSFRDRNGVAYTARVEVERESWQTIRIPLDEIRPNPYFQPPGAKTDRPLDVTDVAAIGFAPQTAGAGQLLIGKISVSGG